MFLTFFHLGIFGQPLRSGTFILMWQVKTDHPGETRDWNMTTMIRNGIVRNTCLSIIWTGEVSPKASKYGKLNDKSSPKKNNKNATDTELIWLGVPHSSELMNNFCCFGHHHSWWNPPKIAETQCFDPRSPSLVGLLIVKHSFSWKNPPIFAD